MNLELKAIEETKKSATTNTTPSSDSDTDSPLLLHELIDIVDAQLSNCNKRLINNTLTKIKNNKKLANMPIRGSRDLERCLSKTNDELHKLLSTFEYTLYTMHKQKIFKFIRHIFRKCFT